MDFLLFIIKNEKLNFFLLLNTDKEEDLMPPTTRNSSPKQKKFTFVINLDDNNGEDEPKTPRTRAQIKKHPPKVIVPEKPTRGRKKAVPIYLGQLESLADLIRLAQEKKMYTNIDVNRLIAIEEELIELHSLIGLEEIKRTIFEQLVFYLQNLHEGSEMYLNTVIYGPPGTGKTTVAKIMGRMFSKLKVIKIPEGYEYEYDDEEEDVEEIFEVARRDDLVGEYLGSTSVKTHEFLECCLGGVVFIDEVYSLGNRDGADSFSKEAIDTINLFLSEHRDHFMMIVAGYKDEIDNCFFSYNEGLRRRFMWYHTIDPYTPEQLRDIFLHKLKQSEWTYEPTVPDAMLRVLTNHKDKFPDNAGSIENFITLIKIKHGKRVFLLPADQKKKITPEDINMAIKVNTTSVSDKNTHLSMYM